MLVVIMKDQILRFADQIKSDLDKKTFGLSSDGFHAQAKLTTNRPMLCRGHQA
jgi:hypothetical protein